MGRAETIRARAEALSDAAARRWLPLTLLFWIGTCAYLLWDRWGRIAWFALSDTDDNLRIAQVRALIAGQGWFDLRQYRLAPPEGADIHWSRIVDLPIAGLKLGLAPFVGGPAAEKAAVALVPLLPMAVAMVAVALIARRMMGARAFLVALTILVCAHATRNMWSPLRIDHHGWQLAMLSLAMLGLVDAKRLRGGLILGLATAVSLSIGLEMLLYLAAAGAMATLMWVWDRREAPRLIAYGASLAGGCAAGFFLFASYANRAPVCDALSPVWLSAMVAAGALAAILGLRSPDSWKLRLGMAAVGGILLAAAFPLIWPHCLGRLEGVPPELDRIWLSRVREALPIYRHDWPVMLATAALPVIGIAGYALMLWRARREPAQLVPWAALALLGAMGAGLLLWQTRAGAAAQLLAVPGAAGLAMAAIDWLWRRTNWWIAVLGAAAALLAVTGVAAQYAGGFVPRPQSDARKAINLANARCPTLPALRPIALQPKGIVLTFVDLGPRLIVTTHHDAIAGPYHRNAAAILDVMHAFRGSMADARDIIERRHVDYVLICPGMSESTVYASEAPDGFYALLRDGEVPDWLAGIALPKESPYKMWRVVRRRS